jgi:hypothetical protein
LVLWCFLSELTSIASFSHLTLKLIPLCELCVFGALELCIKPTSSRPVSQTPRAYVVIRDKIRMSSPDPPQKGGPYCFFFSWCSEARPLFGSAARRRPIRSWSSRFLERSPLMVLFEGHGALVLWCCSGALVSLWSREISCFGAAFPETTFLATLVLVWAQILVLVRYEERARERERAGLVVLLARRPSRRSRFREGAAGNSAPGPG